MKGKFNIIGAKSRLIFTPNKSNLFYDKSFKVAILAASLL